MIRKLLYTPPINYIKKVKKLFASSEETNDDPITYDQNITNTYFNKSDCPKIQIGSGTNVLDGWLNSDLKRKKSLNIIALDASKTFKFSDDSFNFVYSEHTLEHLKFDEAFNMLSESYRILKPEGVIRIAMPDFKFLINLYLENNAETNKNYIEWSAKNFCPTANQMIKDIEPLSVIVINNFFRNWNHQLIYDFKTIKALLEYIGYRDVREFSVGESNHKELQNIEQHGSQIPSEFNLLETFVIQAKK